MWDNIVGKKFRVVFQIVEKDADNKSERDIVNPSWNIWTCTRIDASKSPISLTFSDGEYVQQKDFNEVESLLRGETVSGEWWLYNNLYYKYFFKLYEDQIC